MYFKYATHSQDLNIIFHFMRNWGNDGKIIPAVLFCTACLGF